MGKKVAQGHKDDKWWNKVLGTGSLLSVVIVAGNSCAVCCIVYIADHQSMSNYQKNKMPVHASCVIVHLKCDKHVKHCSLGITNQPTFYAGLK